MYLLFDEPSGNLIEEATNSDYLYAVVRDEIRAGGDVRRWLLVRLTDATSLRVAAGEDLAAIAEMSALVTRLEGGTARPSGIRTRIGSRFGPQITGDLGALVAVAAAR